MPGFRKFLQLRAKFVILLVLLITIPFVVSGIATYRKYSSDVERNTRESTLKIMEQMKLNLDRYVQEIDRVTQAPLYDREVLDILIRHSGRYDPGVYLSAEESNKISLFLSSFASERTEIERMMIFAYDGGLFSNSSNNIDIHWAKDNGDWQNPVHEAGGGLTIVPPHTVHYYSQPRQVISIAREIVHPDTLMPLGIMKVDLTVKGFQRVLSFVDFTPNSRFFIYNRDRELLYPFELAGDEQWLYERVIHDTPDHIASSVYSSYSKLTLVGNIPYDDLLHDARELTTYTAAISIFSLIAAYIIAVLAADRLVKPIRHLQSRMKLVQSGAFNVKAEVATQDEIGQLSISFNNMVDELNRLVREVYETQLREREAELSALQSQMNPHFLYNTLESINMLALHNDQLQISDIVTSLGKLLRYTVEKADRPVTLKDELLFVEHYMQIQSFRLKNRLHADIDIEPSFEDCLVPKLTLQPLIENVIEHAMAGGTVTVRLTAHFLDDDLVIRVKDNGVGLTDAKMWEIERRMNEKNHWQEENNSFGQRRRGFGLRNVHQRLKLLYGDGYGLFIERHADAGACFFIRIPL